MRLIPTDEETPKWSIQTPKNVWPVNFRASNPCNPIFAAAQDFKHPLKMTLHEHLVPMVDPSLQVPLDEPED